MFNVLLHAEDKKRPSDLLNILTVPYPCGGAILPVPSGTHTAQGSVWVQAGLQIRAYGRIREFLIEFLSKSGGGNRSGEEIPSSKSRAFQNFYRGTFGKLDKAGELSSNVLPNAMDRGDASVPIPNA